tara:strand:+ start:1153 stop:1464 length:312 start_codon:yes stop_codon:yes gene_type:complete
MLILNKFRISLLGSIVVLISGCGSQLRDTRGNTYLFKQNSVTCIERVNGGIYCTGSAIKKDIRGFKQVIEFGEEKCWDPDPDPSMGGYRNHFICDAAKKLGKV